MKPQEKIITQWVDGLLIGFIATQALDGVSTFLYEREDRVTRVKEDEARDQLAAYEVAVDRISRAFGVPLQRKDLSVWGWRFHKLVGLSGGLSYYFLRKKNPRLGWGLGLGFGSLFFLVMDEVMMPLLRLTPGPRAFSWKVHARGAVSHVAYGVAAETAVRALA